MPTLCSLGESTPNVVANVSDGAHIGRSGQLFTRIGSENVPVEILRSTIPRVAVVSVLLLMPAACGRLFEPDLSPAARTTYQRSRVELTSGKEIQFERVRVEQDTLFGIDSKNQRVSIPLDEVRAIHERRLSILRTVGAATAAIYAVLLYGLLKFALNEGYTLNDVLTPVAGMDRYWLGSQQA